MTENPGKKEYELSFLLRVASDNPSAEGVSASVGAEELEGIRTLLKKNDAEITSQGHLARQRLAYPIKKETHAIFGFLNFLLYPSAAAGFYHELRLDPRVLRFLLITPPVAKQSARYGSAIRQASGVSAGASESVRAPRVSRAAPPAGGPEGGPSPFDTKGEGPKKTESPAEVLSNEALEKRLEEILQ